MNKRLRVVRDNNPVPHGLYVTAIDHARLLAKNNNAEKLLDDYRKLNFGLCVIIGILTSYTAITWK